MPSDPTSGLRNEHVVLEVVMILFSPFPHSSNDQAHSMNLLNSQNDIEGPFEMSTFTARANPSSPVTPSLSAQSSMTALRGSATDPREGINVQELAPVDRGIRAWTFCISGFVLEMMVWGFGFR